MLVYLAPIGLFTVLGLVVRPIRVPAARFSGHEVLAPAPRGGSIKPALPTMTVSTTTSLREPGVARFQCEANRTHDDPA